MDNKKYASIDQINDQKIVNTVPIHDTPVNQNEIEERLKAREKLPQPDVQKSDKLQPISKTDSRVPISELERLMKERESQIFTIPEGPPPPAPLKN